MLPFGLYFLVPFLDDDILLDDFHRKIRRMNRRLILLRIYPGKCRPKEQYQTGIRHPKQNQHHRTCRAVDRSRIRGPKIEAEQDFPQIEQQRRHKSSQPNRPPPDLHVRHKPEYQHKQKPDDKGGQGKIKELGYKHKSWLPKSGQKTAQQRQRRGNHKTDDQQKSDDHHKGKAQSPVFDDLPPTGIRVHLDTPYLIHRDLKLVKHPRSTEYQHRHPHHGSKNCPVILTRIFDDGNDRLRRTRTDGLRNLPCDLPLHDLLSPKCPDCIDDDNKQSRQRQHRIVGHDGTQSPGIVLIPKLPRLPQQAVQMFDPESIFFTHFVSLIWAKKKHLGPRL